MEFFFIFITIIFQAFLESTETGFVLQLIVLPIIKYVPDQIIQTSDHELLFTDFQVALTERGRVGGGNLVTFLPII